MSTDEDIAKTWPDRWVKANALRPGASKRRNNLRKAWKHHLLIITFRQENPDARCATCKHWAPRHLYPEQRHCTVESDFFGDVLTQADSVCLSWKPAN